jgi:hypothetical protein
MSANVVRANCGDKLEVSALGSLPTIAFRNKSFSGDCGLIVWVCDCPDTWRAKLAELRAMPHIEIVGAADSIVMRADG